jgi:fatty acid amide hydrolase
VRIFLGSASAGGGKDYQRLLGDEKPIPQMQNMFRSMFTPALVMRFLPKLMRARGQNYVAYMMECMGARSTEAYWEIVEARSAYRERFVRSLEEGGFDVVLCPPCALPAITHGSSGDLFPAMTYGLVYNVIGAPAGVAAATRVRPGEESDRAVGKDIVEITAQQVEQGSAGLPVGVQVVARHWREDIVLAVMATLESHFRSTPDYPAYPDLSDD